MGLTADQIYVLNTHLGKPGADVQLGTMLQSAFSIVASEIALANGSVLIGNGSGIAAAQTLSGDATVSNTGVLTIANVAVTTAKLADANVTLGKLATGVAPSHVVKFAGKHTTAGGSATEAFTVTGVADTDIVVATLDTKGGTPVTIVTSQPTLNTVTVVFSGDPSTDHVVSYVVYRAAS